MTVQKNTLQKTDKLNDHDIVQYLNEHHDFFEQHQSLLADMVLVHNSGSAISLIERQVSILREQKDEARSKLHSLIEVADKNEQLSRRFNALILALLDTKSFGQVIEFIQQRLVKDFDAHQVSIRVLKVANITSENTVASANANSDEGLAEAETGDELYLNLFGKVIENRTPVCGRLPIDQLELLFGEGHEKIRSVALIPLIKDTQSDCIGLLAIGSTEKNRFRADMGTLFLNHLSMVLSRVIERHVNRSS